MNKLQMINKRGQTFCYCCNHFQRAGCRPQAAVTNYHLANNLAGLKNGRRAPALMGWSAE